MLVYEPVLGHLLQLSQALKLDSQNISLCFSVLDFFTSHEATGKVETGDWRVPLRTNGWCVSGQLWHGLVWWRMMV